jgi:raffinose/stachyose/melibiose transport system permease protein
MTAKSTFSRVLQYLVLSILLVFILYPLFWIFLLSFKTNADLYNGFSLGLPKVWHFENYPSALKRFNILQYVTNSLIVSIVTIVLTIFLSSMCAYALSRMRFKGQSALRNYLSLGLIIPVQVVIIPIYIMEKALGITNSLFSVVLPYSAFSFSISILMLYAFFRTLPREVEEAACIDGCTIYRAFFSLIAPMMKAPISALVVWIFINVWNEFFVALIFLRRDSIRTLPLGILYFATNVIEWGPLAASLVITVLPTIIIYFIFSNQIEKAMVAGAILK